MMYLVSVYLGMLFGALLGGLVGYGLQVAVGQDGWALAIGALGACFGACWAAFRRAEDKPIWRLPRSAERADDQPAG